MKSSGFAKLLNKINSAFVFALLLLISFAFDGAVIYGMNNSSLVSQEKYVYQTKVDAGKDIHIRFNLSSFSLAAKLSLKSPVDDYNNYRQKEIGRNVSYVLNQSFDVTYEDKTFTCSYATFDDRYSDALTVSRFLVPYGSFSDFDNKELIYVSSDFITNNIRGLKVKEAVGKTIKISLKEEKEYTIAGVVRTNAKGEAGLHFKTLFDGSFVLFNRQLVNEYGFTDLMFNATDDHFEDDYASFINAYNKSYLSFNEARMKISSYQENEQVITSVTSPRYKKTASDDRNAFLSILTMVVVALIYVTLLLFYDFKKVKLYTKIPAASILTGYHFLAAFFIAKQIKKGLFISKASLTMFIVFMVVSLVSYIFIFSLFNLAKKKDHEEKDNGWVGNEQ